MTWGTVPTPFGWRRPLAALRESRHVPALHVALVITELEVGGAERCLVNLACGLDRDRFEVAVYCLGQRPARPQDRLVRRLEDAQIPVQFWDLPANGACRRGAGAAPRARSPAARCRAVDVVSRERGQRLARQAGGPGRVESWVSRGRSVAVAAVGRRTNCPASTAHRVCQPVGGGFRGPADGLDPGRLAVIPNGIDLEAYEGRRPADLTRFGSHPAGGPSPVFRGCPSKKDSIC